MADEMDDADKTEDPSTYRVEEFRRRGEVASSKELTSILVLFAALLITGLSLMYIFETFTDYVEWLYTLDFANAYTEKMLKMITLKTVTVLGKATAPSFLGLAGIGILVNVAQIGFLFAPDVLELNFERINPISGLGKLFTFRAVLEAIKGIFKFTIVLIIVYFFMKKNISSYSGLLHMSFQQAFVVGKDLIMNLSYSIVCGLALVALGDFAYQKLSYKKKLMLSKEEAKREHKEHEGNPEIKQRIKTIQRQMIQKRMMSKVPKADVIVTNPTHLSIALKYDQNNMVSPEVVAKGADHLAMKIREIAKENNIPIVENVMLARNLYKNVKIGGTIPRTLYKAVAEVLAFVYKLKKKEKALGSNEVRF